MIAPGRPPVLELVTEQPEVVHPLQVVSRRRAAAPLLPGRAEVGAEVRDRRPRGDDPGAEVEREGERYEARAAARIASTSGSSLPA